MTFRLAVALIVGAARGIGAGIAGRFVEEGARVVIADTETEAGTAIATALGGRFIVTDISRKDHAERAVSEALAAFGGLDIVVQNAGIYPWSLIENIEPEEWDAVLGVNLRGTYLIARTFTSSITGPRVTSPGHGHYSASKAGINGFIKSTALEFSPYGITVNGVEPGNILTEGMKQHRSAASIRSMEEVVPLGRLATPRDIANAVLFLASDEAAYITGTTATRSAMILFACLGPSTAIAGFLLGCALAAVCEPGFGLVALAIPNPDCTFPGGQHVPQAPLSKPPVSESTVGGFLPPL